MDENSEKVVETEEENPQQVPTPVLHSLSKKEPKKRGVGFTRADKSSTKKASKLAKKQRRINRQRKNQKHRATGSKQRK